ncbi:MAG: hypothetical protein L0Y66_01295, partial [Myxococcaceae bacterium]|nr:hypothetical protein [Myxococcaceae bacterium]
VVFTGELPTLSREEATRRAEAAGAHVTSSVSRNTDFVVVGARPGAKADRARSLGVETVSEAELLRRLGRKGRPRASRQRTPRSATARPTRSSAQT